MQQQASFLDLESPLTAEAQAEREARTKPEPKESPVRKPPEVNCESQRADILQALEWAGDDGVSMLRMIEISPASYRQRISEVRAELEKHGKTIECEKVGRGSLYRIQPFKTK